MNVPKISKGTIIRTIILFIAMVNGILAMFGQQLLPIGEGEVEIAVNAVYAAISAIAVIVATALAWWKNNDFTKKARIKKEQTKTQIK